MMSKDTALYWKHRNREHDCKEGSYKRNRVKGINICNTTVHMYSIFLSPYGKT